MPSSTGSPPASNQLVTPPPPGAQAVPAASQRTTAILNPCQAAAEGAVPAEITSTPKIPKVDEFSPGVLGNQPDTLQKLLNLVNSTAGNRLATQSNIAARHINTVDPVQKDKRAGNVLIGLSQCGIYNLGSSTLTGFGQYLLNLGSAVAINDCFATHLLLNCHGLAVQNIVDTIRARSEPVNNQTIRKELRARGFTVTENDSSFGKIRLWLEIAGVVDSQWNYFDSKLRALVGASTSILNDWGSLENSQRALLEAIKDSVHGTSPTWMPLAPCKKVAESRWSRAIFPEGKFRQKIIAPLEADGWIQTRGVGNTRGGNIGEVLPQPKLVDLKVRLPVTIPSSIPTDLIQKLSTPLSQILVDLKSGNTNVKGVALELLALRLLYDIGLTPIAFRKRDKATGDGEVDVVANGIHLHYSRWVVQCKNTKTVSLSDIAKEVGMAMVMKAQVVAMITTGRFVPAVRAYADQLSAGTTLQAILIDGTVLRKYTSTNDSSHIIETMRQQAEGILSQKRAQVDDEMIESA